LTSSGKITIFFHGSQIFPDFLSTIAKKYDKNLRKSQKIATFANQSKKSIIY